MKLEKTTITPQAENFAQWYQDVVKEADLAENSEVRGCGIVKPYGLKIWQLIKTELAKQILADGVEDVYFPIFIPLENLEQEKEHIAGFSPELAIVTHAGGEELVNKLVIRPTSETAMYKTYAKWIRSYKDLPLRLNQWNNVVRWEKRPRPFLRWSEFQWQEGHTVFATEAEAQAEMWHILEIYKNLYKFMGIPVFDGKKSEQEKFAGAVITTTVEAMAKDGKAIQGGTSHYLGTNFAKVFDIKYTGEDKQEHLGHQNSWGVSWRAVGAVVMTHGDDNGLRLPPNIAPIQIVIVPITKDDNRQRVLEFIKNIQNSLGVQYRIKIDDRDNLSPGFKFNDWELKGVPMRFEIGAQEATENKITVFRRDLNTKIELKMENLANEVEKLSQDIQNNLYQQAQDFATSHIHRIENMAEIKEQKGFFEASWSETAESEKILKEKFSMVSRLLPKNFENAEPKNKKCFITGQPAKHDWYFARSY